MPPALQLRTYRRSKSQGLPPDSRALPALSRKDSAKLNKSIAKVTVGLPELAGSPIFISVGPQLTAHSGKLLSGSPDRGTQIYAASFIRDRHIVLDSHLLARPRLLRLILVHEIFHFVWPRLGNPARRLYEALLTAERQYGAIGELGESASVGKLAFRRLADLAPAERHWRDYVCESFCDTAAWLYAGVDAHTEFTLARRWQQRREVWFEKTFATPRSC